MMREFHRWQRLNIGWKTILIWVNNKTTKNSNDIGNSCVCLCVCACVCVSDRAIFVWPWNKNVRTIQKQQTNRNRAIWLVYRTHTNAGGFWLVKRALGWKNFMPENFLETNPYFALTSYCNTIGQSHNAYSILGFYLAGKLRGHVLILSSIGW